MDDETIANNNDGNLWCSSQNLYHVNPDDGTEYYGTPGSSNDDCDADGDSSFYFADGEGDCNDADANVFPGAIEGVNDGVDQNCDGFELCVIDDDVDGLGNDAGLKGLSTSLICDELGFASNEADCDDNAASVYPFAPEGNDSIDDNCDGLETLSTPITTCIGDAYFDSTLGFSTYILACDTPTNWMDGLSICQSAGYDGLAKIRTATLNSDLEAIMNQNFWLGLNDISAEGTFEWSDSTLLDTIMDYQNWKDGLNSNLNEDKDCVRMNQDGEWEDKACSDTNNRIACSIEL